MWKASQPPRRPVHRPGRRPAAVAVLAALAALLAAPAARAAEPFYERLLEDGNMAYVRGDYEEAIESLRIACFGMLDEPDALAGCLTRLALAQAGARHAAAFGETFQRLLEIERRFSAYSQLQLTPEQRRSFEEALEQWVPYETLRLAPAFADVAGRKLAAEIAGKKPAERRDELRRLLTRQPDNADWQVLLAELDLEAGDVAAASRTADAALARRPDLPRALCLRGRIAAGRGDCEPALRDLTSCPAEGPGETAVAEARLGCHLAQRDWPAADKLLRELPADKQERPGVKRLARDLKRERRSSSPPAAGEVAEEALPEDAVPEEVAPIETAPPPPAVSRLLEEGQALLRAGAGRDELAAMFERVQPAADEYPGQVGLQTLAAEIAYRLTQWDDSVTYFRRSGPDGPPQSVQQFYLSVALYETGEFAAAAEMLERCLPQLQQTDFVRGYTAKIRSSS